MLRLNDAAANRSKLKLDHVLPGLALLSQPTVDSNGSILNVQEYILCKLVATPQQTSISGTRSKQSLLSWHKWSDPTQHDGKNCAVEQVV